jgi:PAS domain S-box-containing protein
MSLRLKLWLGLGSLLAVLMLVLGIGLYQLFRTTTEAEAVTHDNLRSVEYSRRMIESALLLPDTSARRIFQEQIMLELANITEPGEQALANELLLAFEELISNSDSANRAVLQNQLVRLSTEVQRLNIVAIQIKSIQMEQNNTNAIRALLVVGAFAMIIAIVVLYNFPNSIIRPLKLFTANIKAISDGQYDRRVAVASKDELGHLADAFNNMAAKLLVYERSSLSKLILEQHRTESVLEALQDAIIVLDEFCNVLYMNPLAEVVVGLPTTSARGMSATELALRNDLLRLLLNAESAFDEHTKPIAITVENQSRYYQPYRIRLMKPNPQYDESHPLGTVLGLRDVSHFQELDTAKTYFLATISHELKTPLSSINLSLKLLEDSRVGPLVDEQKKLVSNIRLENDRLIKLVSELLNLAQLESGRIQLNPMPVNAVLILQQAIEAIRSQADAKQIILELISTPELNSLQLLADPQKTIWVLTNIIGNAVRYSPVGSLVTVSITSSDTSIHYSVSDEGPGITPEYRERIFERYFRLPDDLTKVRNGGTGIGLAIAQEFIRAQGGRIWVESNEKAGSTFIIELPLI